MTTQVNLRDINSNILYSEEVDHCDIQQIVKNALDNGIDLRGLNHPYISFKNFDFSYTYLQKCNFQHAKFENCNFTNAKLHKSDFHEAIFKNCNMTNTNLTQCNFRLSKFDNSPLDTCDIQNAIGNGVDIVSTQICEHNVVFTKNQLAIGCKLFSINEWKNFTDSDILDMLEDHIHTKHPIEKWNKYKNHIFNSVELYFN